METEKIKYSNGKIDLEKLSENTKMAVESTKAAFYKVLELKKVFDFKSVLTVIDEIYDFSPQSFNVWEQNNESWENESSLKILYYAMMMWYSKDETLKLFWELKKEAEDNTDWGSHKNIRALKKYGIESVEFSWIALTPKNRD